MGLLDELLKVQKPKRNLMDTQMVKGPDQPYLRQDYPTVYGALGGLLGTAPDEMAGSVMDPNTAAVRQGAEYGFPVGTALGVLPMARFTKGLPVGMGIKDVGKSAITREGNPIQSAVVLVGDKIFMGRTHGDALNRAVYEGVVRKEGGKYIFPKGAEVNSDLFMTKDGQIIDRLQASKMFDIGASETAIEKGLMQNNPPKSMTVDSYIKKATELKKQREQSTYPQQAALDLAQQRAALPVSEGGLGLPANNTAMDRARAMGFKTPALHGSGTPNINAFDPNLVGTKAGNAFDNYMWFTSNPESASGYALNTNQFALIPEVKALNSQMSQIGKDISSAYTNKNMDKVGELRKELNAIMKQKSDIYKDFEMGRYVSEGSTIYPVLLKTNQFMPYEAGGKNWMKANRPAIEESQSRGFQGVEIRNVKDNPNPSVGSLIADTYATENPDLIRSRFAAFDPFRRSAAIAATMGVAAPDLLAAPIDEEELRRLQSGLLYAP